MDEGTLIIYPPNTPRLRGLADSEHQRIMSNLIVNFNNYFKNNIMNFSAISELSIIYPLIEYNGRIYKNKKFVPDIFIRFIPNNDLKNYNCPVMFIEICKKQMFENDIEKTNMYLRYTPSLQECFVYDYENKIFAKSFKKRNNISQAIFKKYYSKYFNIDLRQFLEYSTF
ncbi:MAG: hypothetical protein ABSG15_00730 [FCB group bacterium]|jgi:Uma2 family endonuclease